MFRENIGVVVEGTMTREGYFADPSVIERIEVVSGASAVQGRGVRECGLIVGPHVVKTRATSTRPPSS